MAAMSHCLDAKFHNIKPLISQPTVIEFSCCLIFSQPEIKIFNLTPVYFCHKPSRLAAILKNCYFR